MVIKAADSNQAFRLLYEYFQAWEGHDVPTIRQIFSADAVYEILGSKVLHGIHEIVEYWETNKRTQRDVRCRIIRSSAGRDFMVCHWQARFLRVDKASWYNLDGLMWLTVKGTKIVQLTESFAQHVQPAEDL